jgi:hypothetical protein
VGMARSDRLPMGRHQQGNAARKGVLISTDFDD